MTQKPNILFIHTDQQRADSIGCYGNPVIRTPNLDRLGRDGVVFENAHCTHPLCMPARASLLTGRYIHAHKLYRNGIPLSEEEPTIASLLKEHGYRTGLIGKAHFTPYKGDPDKHVESVQVTNKMEPEEVWNYWRGFERSYYGFDDVRMAMGHGSYGMNGGHYGLWVHENHPDKVPLYAQEAALAPTDKRFKSWKSAVPLELHSSTWITEQTVQFIKENKAAPFYAWVGFQEPHEPFNPPKPYCDMYDPGEVPLPVRRDGEWPEKLPEHIDYYLNRGHWKNISEAQKREIIAHYYGMVSLVDDCVGRIMAALEQEGLSDNTIIVFTSDHGEWLGDHDLWLKGAVHTRGLTRIPMIVKWPGTAVQGHRVREAASHVDIVPTLLDAAGAAIPYGVQGQSLREALTGGRPARDYALIEHRHEPAHINRLFQKEDGIINTGETEFYMKTIVTERYRFSYMPGISYGELFDLQEDPHELRNLWESEPELRTRLQLKLLDALIESQDPLPQRKWPV